MTLINKERMKITYWMCTFIALFGFAVSNNLCIAQSEEANFIVPRTNSKSTVTQTIASTQIEIIYNRPNKRNREIFGNLVPYGKIWRTGSDEATSITFSTPVTIGGKSIDAGKYELFTIPNQKEWKVILQKSNNQWGSYRYDEENDVVRFSVTPMNTTNVVETFTIGFGQISSDGAQLNISWDNVAVSIKLGIDLKSTVVPALEKALAEEEGRIPNFQAAMFYYENEIDISRAEELMALALEKNPGHIGMLYRYALILRKKGDMKGAKKAAEESLAGAQNMKPELKTEYTKLNTNFLKEIK